MKCEKCGCDPRPCYAGDIQMRPCGLIDNATWVCDMKINGCPVSDWQDGYAAALQDFEKKQKPAETGLATNHKGEEK